MNVLEIPRNVFHAEAVLLAHLAGRLLRLGNSGDPWLDEAGGWAPVAYDLAGWEWMGGTLYLRVTAKAGETWASVTSGCGADAPRLATLTSKWFHWGPRDRRTPSEVLAVANAQLPRQLRWIRRWLVGPPRDCRYEMPLRSAEVSAERIIRIGEMRAVRDPMVEYLNPLGLGKRFSAWAERAATRVSWGGAAGLRIEREESGSDRWSLVVPEGVGNWSSEKTLQS